MMESSAPAESNEAPTLAPQTPPPANEPVLCETGHSETLEDHQDQQIGLALVQEQWVYDVIKGLYTADSKVICLMVRIVLTILSFQNSLPETVSH